MRSFIKLYSFISGANVVSRVLVNAYSCTRWSGGISVMAPNPRFNSKIQIYREALLTIFQLTCSRYSDTQIAHTESAGIKRERDENDEKRNRRIYQKWVMRRAYVLHQRFMDLWNERHNSTDRPANTQHKHKRRLRPDNILRNYNAIGEPLISAGDKTFSGRARIVRRF